MTFCAVPAHAGTWLLQITSGSGTATATNRKTQTWTAPPATTPPPPSPTAPPPPTNSVSTPSLSNGQSATAGGGTATASANLTVTVTGTWQADPTLPSDPPPPKVLVSESSSAYANDTSSDASGNSTPAVPGSSVNDGLGDSVDPSAQPIGTAHGTKYVPESSGTFTVTLTLQSTATAKAGPNGTNPNGMGFLGSGICSAGVGPVTIGIHAQPYNWHITGVAPGPAPTHGIIAGELEFLYAWSSTSGSIPDLKTCFFHEIVTYPGPNPFTVPAPFSWTNPLPNGVPYPGSGTNGLAMTDLANGRDVQHYFTPVQPYFVGTLSTTQVFQFDDTATGDTNVQIPGTDATATILRSFSKLNNTSPWYYTVSKSSSSTTVAVAP